MTIDPDFDDPDFDDEELNDAFRSGAHPAEPSSTHFNRLRLKLLANTGRFSHQDDSQLTRPSHRNRGRLLLRLSTAAAVLLIAFIATRTFTGTADANLRSALDVTRRHVWIHSSTTVTHAGETVELEAWCAPIQRITAFRSPQMLHLIDYAEGVQSSYSEKTDTVFRWRAEMNGEEMGRTFINALLTSGDLTSSFPWHNVSTVKKSIIEKDGLRKTQYSFQLELKASPKVRWETFVHAEPTTGLIETWEEIHADGTRVLTRFDYPVTGPTDIFALGANRDAKVVDRVASSDVVELSKKFQEEIHNFDNYEALVIDRPAGDSSVSTDAPLLRYIRRQGKSYSVDLLHPITSEFSIPENVDLTWWQINRHEFSSTRLATCDGDTCTMYPYDHSSPWASSEICTLSELPCGNKQTTIPVVSVKTSTGMTTIPIWPGLWPEYACRPFLVTTDPTVRFDVDPAGTDGPPNTLRIRLIAPDSPFAKERANYWLALGQTHCVSKSIVSQPSFDCFTKGPTEKIVVSEFSNFQTSPKGIAFATQRVSSDANGQNLTNRTFVVDFDPK